MSIDSAYTRDIDDAFSVERTTTGWKVTVAIANVAAGVHQGSNLDQEARSRVATVYARDRAVQSMLPRSFSEDHLALVSNKDRAAMVFNMFFAADFTMELFHFEEGSVRVNEPVPYDEVSKCISSRSDVGLMLADAAILGEGLLRRRRSQGELAFYDIQQLILSAEDGSIQHFRNRDEVIGHIIVQELMIATNKGVAEFAVHNNLPILFRNHVCRASAPTPAETATIVTALLAGGQKDIEQARARLALFSEPARYGAKVQGHYALASPAYCHCTSPIRRYPDLVTQRILTAFLRKKPIPVEATELDVLADHCNKVIRDRAEMRKTHYKDAAELRGSESLSQGSLQGLSPLDLHQAVKAAIKANELNSPAITEAVCERLKDGTLFSKTIFALLTADDAMADASINVAIGEMLAATPAKSVSLLNEASQAGIITELSIAGESTGTIEVPAFKTTISAVKSTQQIIASGCDRSKKGAEQNAALRFFELAFGVIPKPPIVDGATLEPPLASNENFKGRLNEHCQQFGWPLPSFESNSTGPSHAPFFTVLGTVVADRESIHETGQGRSKKDAEQDAARKLLDRVKAINPSRPSPQPEHSPLGDFVNPVGMVQEYAQTRKLPMPMYSFTTIPGPKPIRCVGRAYLNEGSFIDAAADASSKADAKRAVAQQVAAALMVHAHH